MTVKLNPRIVDLAVRQALSEMVTELQKLYPVDVVTLATGKRTERKDHYDEVAPVLRVVRLGVRIPLELFDIYWPQFPYTQVLVEFDAPWRCNWGAVPKELNCRLGGLVPDKRVYAVVWKAIKTNQLLGDTGLPIYLSQYRKTVKA